MTALVFVDTNILVYAVSDDQVGDPKQRKAEELLSQTRYAVSYQVLQEFYTVVTRGLRPILDRIEAKKWVESLAEGLCVPIDRELIVAAWRIEERYQINYWHAAILAAAMRLNCATLYSEDLNHGQDYGGVRVVNPFR
jgi:predicted nucleic acid-binding protein